MSDANNALDLIRGAKSAIAEQQESHKNCENYKDDAKDKLQLLNSAKKAMESEITDTIKERRKVVEDEYEKPLKKAESALEKAKSQKEKAKQKAINARIKTETLDFNQEIKNLKAENKEAFKAAGIPTILNKGPFYRLIAPHGFKEILFFLCTFIISIFLVPLVVFLFVPRHPKMVLFLLIAVFAVVSVLLYFLLWRATKGKNPDVIIAARRNYDKILSNRKKIERISNEIEDDTDESSYNLSSYDNLLEKARADYDDRKFVYDQAMEEFEKYTRPQIESEITKKHAQNIAKCQIAYEQAQTMSDTEAERFKAKTQYIQNHYISTLGKNYMKDENLNALEEMLSNDPSLSLDEAIETLKSRK